MYLPYSSQPLETRGGRVTFGLVATTLAIGLVLAPARGQETEPPPPAVPDAVSGIQVTPGIDVLGRGPIHEAFASPVSASGQPTTTVPEAPPVPINEIPPEVRPTDSVWIPGYWFWDDLIDDYVWVSGVWRVPPPGQQWVPGYWHRLDNGARWVSGFWVPMDATGVTYMDPPPASRDRGPTYEQPSENHFWIPGVWLRYDTGYRWRHGYWAQRQPGWIWIPQHYAYTPRGAVLTGGYWDYPVEQRGVAFCPVYFQTPLFRQGGFEFTPTAAIINRHLLLHMFVGPRWHHYFYGDYYGRAAVEAGLVPWFRRDGVANYPLLSYYTWYFDQQNVDYLQRMNNWYAHYDRNPAVRPPVLFADQQRIAARIAAEPRVTYSVLTQPITAVRTGTMVPVTPDQMTSLVNFSRELRSLSQQRISIEVENEPMAATDSQAMLPLPAMSRQFFPAVVGSRAEHRQVLRPIFDRALVDQPPAESSERSPGYTGEVYSDAYGRPLPRPRREPVETEVETAPEPAEVQPRIEDDPAARGWTPRSAFTPGGDPNRNTPDLRRPGVAIPGQRQSPEGDRPGVSVPGRTEAIMRPRPGGGYGPPANTPPGAFSPGGDPNRNAPDLQRTDQNIPGRGQTPEGGRPGVAVPGRTEAIMGPRPGGAAGLPADTPRRAFTPGGDPNRNVPDLQRPDMNVPGRGQTPEGPRPGINVPGRTEAQIRSRGASLNVPEFETQTIIPGRNDLNAGETPELNRPLAMEPPRGYVPGRVAPGMRRPSIYQPGITEVPGRADDIDGQTPMPRVEPQGTDIPQVDPSTGQRMPRLAPSQQNPAQRRSMFRGVNPETNPPRTSPHGNAPRVSPPADNPRRDPAALPSQSPQTGGPRTNTPQAVGGATRLPGGNSLPGGISPNFGGATPNIGGMSRPGGDSATGGQPHAGNNPGPTNTRRTDGAGGTSGTSPGRAGGAGGGNR